MLPCKPVSNLYLHTWPRTNNSFIIPRTITKNHLFSLLLKCFLSRSFRKLHFPISRVLCHLSFFFFYFFSGTQVSRTSVKNAKSYELKSEIEKFRGIFRSIVYRVQHIVNKRRESMAFDFQTFGRRHENLCLLFTNRWRGETWIYVFSFIRSRGVYFTILSGDAEAYGRATNSPKGTLILSN